MSGAARWTGGAAAAEEDRAKLEDFERRVDPNDKEQMDLLEQMKQHTEKLEKMREFEDPRLSFTTPEFKEAQRIFQENFKAKKLWQTDRVWDGETIPVERADVDETRRARRRGRESLAARRRRETDFEG
ncbi:predicted protein [Ostreococcus lucimarinus CCE9901]|uniref:Uncharacterized protein n=1 Tax=Ostreococcus lucimarinus (strain CCE9901) TaxID=436017 RepID=A4S0G3_OSTLU|nr:predicted protein [Ostreococcus lucimarinus CCE9901]ABO97260.1 predicted protein [Ostreococcus lucimarinus CCE9901]|eukprot:XP_001418967.1 predicted protein [Ostreococcus lucimarinus CCE9901]